MNWPNQVNSRYPAYLPDTVCHSMALPSPVDFSLTEEVSWETRNSGIWVRFIWI